MTVRERVNWRKRRAVSRWVFSVVFGEGFSFGDVEAVSSPGGEEEKVEGIGMCMLLLLLSGGYGCGYPGGY